MWKKWKNRGIDINFNQLNKGLLTLLHSFIDDQPAKEKVAYQSAFGLGMLPGPFMDIVRVSLGKSFDDLVCKHYGITTETITESGIIEWSGVTFSFKDTREEFVRDAMHEFTLFALTHKGV